MAQFLEMAAEILVGILRRLPYQDLLRCLTVCRFFYDIITKTPEIDYRILLQVAGKWDNPCCRLPTPLRASLLDKQETSWLFFKPSGMSKSPMTVPSQTFSVFSTTFSLGISSIGDESQVNELAFLSLPFRSGSEADSRAKPMHWYSFRSGKPVVAYALAVEVHDLLVLVVGDMCSDLSASVKLLTVVLLQYSTRRPHPSVQQNIIPLLPYVDDLGVPKVGVDVSEENLAISAVYQEPIRKKRCIPHNQLHWCVILNAREPTKHRIPVFETSVVFLRDDILISPNPFRESIDIYHVRASDSVSSSDSSGTAVRLIYSLGLPALLPGFSMVSISCTTQPSTTSEFPKFAPKSRPFLNDPANAIIPFAILVLDSETTRQAFTMIVHRKSLLELVPWDRTDPDVPGLSVYHGIRDDVPLVVGSIQSWDAWGPPVSRWFSGIWNHLEAYKPCVSGSRYLQYMPHDTDDWDAGIRDTIHILDFNPAVVRKARHQKWHENEHEGVHIKLFDSKDPEDNRRSAKHFFAASDVIGMLPYVECVSKARWDFDEMAISEDYLIGLKYDSEPVNRQLKEVTPIHFG